MTEQELITKLKNNEKPFGLLSKEEQEYLQRHQAQVEMFGGKIWYGKGVWGIDSPNNTYRISPDYKAEPEYSLETFRKGICSCKSCQALAQNAFNAGEKSGRIKALEEMLERYCINPQADEDEIKAELQELKNGKDGI